MKRILVTGASGQIGSEVLEVFREHYGRENVIGLDIRPASLPGPHETIDAMDKDALRKLIDSRKIDAIVHLVAVLSATGEKKPEIAWKVNMDSLKNMLELAREFKFKLFWPSSIAVFGAGCPRNLTPQTPPLLPQTMYGITKVAGELLCDYYFRNFEVDVRSIRYPGIISYKTPPGGGTTDYAVEIFYRAIEEEKYDCFLKAGATLPMMYMNDAVRAIYELMNANPERIKIRTSYNLAACSFSPQDLVAEIQKHIPQFTCRYLPDKRQQIAESWPKSIDDSEARNDWGWKHEYDTTAITEVMLKNLREKLGK